MLVPFLIVAPIFYLWQELFVHFRPVRFFSKISLLGFWIFGGGHVWYLAVLIPLYILFPLMYYILHKGKSRFVFVIIIWILFDLIIHYSQPDYCRIIENAFTSVFAFMIGILISDKADNINRGGWIAVFCGILSFPVASILTDGNNFIVRYSSCLVGMSMTYLFAYILQKLNNKIISLILNLIGSYSLELYITNIFTIELANYYFDMVAPIYRWILILLIGAIISLFLKLACNKLHKLRLDDKK